MSIYSRWYIDESVSRISSDRHSDSDFDDAIARILDVIVCKNMDIEEMMAIFDEIKSVMEQDGNACYDPDYLSDLKRRIERRRYNESKQTISNDQAQQQSHMGSIRRKKQKRKEQKKDVDDRTYRFKCFGCLR